MIVVALAATSCTGAASKAIPAAGSSRQNRSGSTELIVRRAGFRLRAPIQRAVSVRDGTNVIIAGGLDAAGTTVDGVYLLHTSSGRLTNLGALASPVHDATGEMFGHRLFVFGGGSTASSDLVQVFDLDTRSASIVGHLPVALSDLASSVVGKTIYLIGGYDGHSARREIYATRDGARFRKVAMLPTGLRYPAVTAVGSEIVIAGGETPTGPSKKIWSLATSSGKIQVLGNLPEPVGHAAAFTLGGQVYVAGGTDASGGPVSAVTRVDPATGDVESQRSLPLAISDVAVSAGVDDVVLVGGADRGGAVNDVLIASTRDVASPKSSVGLGAPTPSADPSSIRPFAGLLLVADRGNDRLLVMNAKKKVLWRYPSPGLPAPPHPLYFPDDAFWVHGGHAILVNEEENDTLVEIAYPSGKVLWTYGHPRSPGSAPGYLHQPDDLYPYPGGGVVVADALNCRVLFLDARGLPSRQIGRTGVCSHGLPGTVGYPNGDTPLPNGNLLISELNGHWVDEVTPSGRIVWARQLPGIVEPSDPQRLSDGTFMVASYSRPGAVVIFNRKGRVLWSYHPGSGQGMLDHPSLAAPFPNGLIAVNDDRNHRVVLIDRKTRRIVWQYGRTGVQGTRAGLLSYPDGLDLLLPGGVIPLHVDFSSDRIHKGRP